MIRKEPIEMTDWTLAQLELLKEEPELDAQAAARMRLRYIQAMQSAQMPVSAGTETRLKGWKIWTKNLFSRKENVPMLRPIFALFVALGLVFGGLASSVQAAQSSLPGEALYSLKLAGEDLQLRLAFQDQARLQLEGEHAQERVKEMLKLQVHDPETAEALMTRLQTHLEQQLRLAAGMEDGEMAKALEQLRERTRQQLQLMEQDGEAKDPLMEQVREQTREQLRQHLQLIELGLQDPQQFREQVREQARTRLNAAPERSGNGPKGDTQAPGGAPAGNQQGGGPQVTAEPQGTQGSGNSYGPSATEQPGSSYGPSPSEDPGSGPGPGPSNGPGPGGGSNTNGGNGNGSGNGGSGGSGGGSGDTGNGGDSGGSGDGDSGGSGGGGTGGGGSGGTGGGGSGGGSGGG